MLDTPPQSWDDVWALTPNHDYSWVQSAPLAWQPEDTPSGPLRVELITYNALGVGASKSAMLAYTDGATNLTRYFGEIINTEFAPGRWAKISTATPPQKFTAPLSDGYSGSLFYLKTQENIVIASFDVYKTDNSSINGVNLIGTLPEGFRGISGYCAALAMGVGGGSIVGAAQAWCNTDGSIQTLCPSGTYRIRGEIVFCAN